MKMKKICVNKGILIYYGNPAGYRQDGKIVLDPIFVKEDILRYIHEQENAEVEVRAGVYDRLIQGERLSENPVKYMERRIRIYQLKQDVPIMMKFVSLKVREERGYGTPCREEYVLVYEAETQNFDLEEVWETYGKKIPEHFNGRALAISDVIEFCDGKNSRFFYVQPDSYAEISFLT